MAVNASWSVSRARPHRVLSKSAVGTFVAFVDALIVFGSGLLIFLAYVENPLNSLSIYSVTTLLTTYFLVHGLHAAGMYEFDRIVYTGNQLGRIVTTCTITFLALLAIAYGLKISAEFSRVWAVTWWLVVIVSLKVVRLLAASIIPMLARKGTLSRRVAIYGSGEHAKHFLTHLKKLNEPWNVVLGVYDDRGTRLEGGQQQYPISGDLEALIHTARRERADEVLVALPWIDGSDRIDHVLRRLSVLPANIRLVLTPSMARHLDRIDMQFGVPVASVFETPMTGARAFVKRIFDLIVGSVALLLAAPAILLVALAIKLDSPGPVFFKQERFGFNDELIKVWKFRTMYQDQTDAKAERLATADDPRVTRVGYFLRRSSLDELPQLFNVIIGNMSLVGPRPHATRAKAGGRLYQEVVEHYSSRHRVKPGLTGWAQVNGWRGETDTDEKIIHRVEHDLYYISHWSLGLDIKIILMTVWVVFSGANAY